MPEGKDGVAREVLDYRRPAFCYQTHDALDLIASEFSGAKLATARSVYVALTEHANRRGGAAARGGFEAPRSEIAESSGVSVDTLDRYIASLVKLGLVSIERRKVGKVNLPNVWALVDAAAGAPPSRTGAARGSRTGAAPRARDSSSEPKKGPEEEPPLPPPPAEPPEADLSVPPAVWIDGRTNLPLDALTDVCGIDPASPRMTQAVIALNGRGRTVGIRALYWIECQRYAEAHGMEGELENLHAEPEVFARLLADRVRRKAAALLERDHWRTSLDPDLLRKQWLDLELRRPDQGMSAEDIRRFGAAVEGMDAEALRQLAAGTA
ncbi:MAG: hypothetical protein ACJ79H_21680 [Myxococcales bacterium]